MKCATFVADVRRSFQMCHVRFRCATFVADVRRSLPIFKFHYCHPFHKRCMRGMSYHYMLNGLTDTSSREIVYLHNDIRLREESSTYFLSRSLLLEYRKKFPRRDKGLPGVFRDVVSYRLNGYTFTNRNIIECELIMFYLFKFLIHPLTEIALAYLFGNYLSILNYPSFIIFKNRVGTAVEDDLLDTERYIKFMAPCHLNCNALDICWMCDMTYSYVGNIFSRDLKFHCVCDSHLPAKKRKHTSLQQEFGGHLRKGKTST